MSLFNFSVQEFMTFFAVMVRFSVLVAVLPFVGDRFVPTPAKILFALAVTFALFPVLVSTKQVQVNEALVWGATTGGILGTVALEVIVGLVLGFTARLLFDAIHFGSNLAGNFMGFAAASTFDPHQESQTQIVAELQLAIATLIFLAIDGHHLMLRSVLDSYRIVGLGKVGMTAAVSSRLVEMSGQVLKFAIQIAAPVAVSLFAVNVAFGVISKAIPQLNVLVLSLSASAMIGLIVMFLSIPEFHGIVSNLFGKLDDWLGTMMVALAVK